MLCAVQLSELQEMAGQYGEMMEENRRLYNEVQDLKGKIRVFCRVRPAGATGDCAATCTEVGVDGQASLAYLLKTYLCATSCM